MFNRRTLIAFTALVAVLVAVPVVTYWVAHFVAAHFVTAHLVFTTTAISGCGCGLD